MDVRVLLEVGFRVYLLKYLPKAHIMPTLSFSTKADRWNTNIAKLVGVETPKAITSLIEINLYVIADLPHRATLRNAPLQMIRAEGTGDGAILC